MSRHSGFLHTKGRHKAYIKPQYCVNRRGNLFTHSGWCHLVLLPFLHHNVSPYAPTPQFRGASTPSQKCGKTKPFTHLSFCSENTFETPSTMSVSAVIHTLSLSQEHSLSHHRTALSTPAIRVNRILGAHTVHSRVNRRVKQTPESKCFSLLAGCQVWGKQRLNIGPGFYECSPLHLHVLVGKIPEVLH